MGRWFERGFWPLFAWTYWALSRTWRVRRIVPPGGLPEGGYLLAHWHGDELVLVATEAFRGTAVLSSKSRDGERMATVLRALRYHVLRGSSSRGGVGGLKGLMDAVRRHGRVAALAVDGPKGPIYDAKPGIVKLAEQTGKPIVPIAAAAARRFVFSKAWNRCYVPFPFSECVVALGEPLPVPHPLSDEARERCRQRLNDSLNALRQQAEDAVAEASRSGPAASPSRSGSSIGV
jgi:lysophospholipid acyltransferase (LPLAT)-like uncharacterized protein